MFNFLNNEKYLTVPAARATARESLSLCGFKVHSNEHDAEHGARSGKEQLPARSETTKPGASSCYGQP